MPRLEVIAACLVLSACRPGYGREDAYPDPMDDEDAPDATGDAVEEETDALDSVEADPDVASDDDGAWDVTVPDGETSVATPPADVLRTGTAGLLLTGVVLTPTGVLDPGDVLVDPDGTISCVDADCSSAAGAGDATWIDTHGIISPSLIDAHNHVAYNFLPEWVPDPPRLFQNRYEWAEDPAYEDFIAPYANHRSTSSHFCPAAKWGELRSIVHATTTIQGESFAYACVHWGARNADNFHDLGYDHMRTTIGSVRDITDADAANYVASFEDPVEPVTRLAVHMAEGYAGSYVTEEFDSFAGRDPRPNRHAGLSLLGTTSLLIHCVPLTEAQLVEAHDAGASIAWSPSSNMILYGVTAPIARILELGIPTAIAPDWTSSGEDEMLSEMRFGLEYGIANAIAALTTERLWRMATSDAAIVVGLDSRIGRLEPGAVADIAVFGRAGPDPYRALIDSRAADVRLVLVGGAGWYGDDGLSAATARNSHCEPFDACGTAKYICVQESPTAPDRGDETLEDIRIQLYNILEGIGYPPEEAYGRGDELLPLVDCSI